MANLMGLDDLMNATRVGEHLMLPRSCALRGVGAGGPVAHQRVRRGYLPAKLAERSAKKRMGTSFRGLVVGWNRLVLRRRGRGRASDS
jgi:hypothetical protein